MRLANSATHFGLVTKLLHWSQAGLMLFLVWLGWYMVQLSYFDSNYNRALTLHKSLGLLVFGLGCAFIAWKFASRSPAKLAQSWQVAASAAMHGTLIVLMLLIPLSGFVISTSAGKGVSFFEIAELPALIQADEGLRDAAIAAHFYLAYGLIALVAGHAAAALKHQLFDRDGTLARMIWR